MKTLVLRLTHKPAVIVIGICFFFSCFAQVCLAAAKKDSPIAVEARVDPDKATLGDIITYTLLVRHDETITPSPPQLTPPDGLEFVDQGAKKPYKKDNQRVHEFWFRLRADQVGTLTLPSVTVPFAVTNAKNETIPGSIASPEVQLEIQSILRLQGEPTDIRDIKPIETVGRDWFPILLAGLASALLIALAVYFWRKRRKTMQPEPTPQMENLSAQELALRELNQLQAKGLLEKGHVREYYFQLSEIFRRYLGNKFKFPALDWTTEEITDFLKRSFQIESLYSQYKEQIVSILKRTDLVKFAKAPVARDENMMEEIVIFIQTTSREEEPRSTSPQPLTRA